MAIPAMDAFVKYYADTDVTVRRVGVVFPDTLAAIGRIFKDRALFSDATMTGIIHDMDLFAQPPFYTFEAVRNGKTVGGCVLRAHLLSNGERLIQLELIASASDAGRGAGTSMMRVVRALSQVSSAHNGHVTAFTLKNAATVRFYERKLPEVGPSARAFLYSIYLLDDAEFGKMPKHLEMRSVCVRPVA